MDRADGERARQEVERTGCRAHPRSRNPQVSCCGRQTLMTEQQLYRPDVGPGFQQVDGESVTQQMRRDWFGQPRSTARCLTGILDCTFAHALAGRATFKEPLNRTRSSPVLP